MRFTDNNDSNNDTGCNSSSNNNNNNNNIDDTNAHHVGGLLKSVRKALKNQTLNFKINVECTSLKVSPSGNYLWGGFSDGTLRVWDLSGTFGIEDDSVIASRQKMDVMVNSKLTQGYGAVACQIHARGVHTDLITTVDISDDSQYIFMGVSRGATELYAVYIGDLENAVHQHKKEQAQQTSASTSISSRNILDYLKVYCHSDGKLKGFGACATTKTTSSSVVTSSKSSSIGSVGSTDSDVAVAVDATTTLTTTTTTTSYLLLTGKGIKNIHIWKFIPPKYHPRSSSISYEYNDNDDIYDEEEDNGIWEQIYDTPTNGSSIHLLAFYRSQGVGNGKNKLLAVSKSGTQKLRLWDLSSEEEGDNNNNNKQQKQRPKRPPYEDVDNSQSALEIAGGIGICGGGIMYNVMSIVSLDRPNDPFNHTELALPTGSETADSSDPFKVAPYSSRRQRRGEMKAVVNVATSPRDSSHALLELDDGSLIGYSAGSSTAKDFHGIVPRLARASPESTGIPALPADFWRRCICLANISGVVIAASSLYNPNTNKGQLVIRALGGLKKPRGGVIVEKQKQKQKQKRQPKSSQQQQLSVPKLAPSPPPQTTASPLQMQSSPIAADQQALRNAVSAPPMSDVVSNNKKKLLLCGDTGITGPLSSSISSSSSSLTRVSPDQKKQTNIIMETPIHRQKLHKQPNSTNSMITTTTTTTSSATDNDSPESREGLPNITKYLVPKRIVMQQENQTSSTKKRKASVLATATKINAGIDSGGGGGSQTTSGLSKKEMKAIKKAKKAAAAAAMSVVAPGQEKSTYKTNEKTATEVLSVISGGKKEKKELQLKNVVVSPSNESSTAAMDPTFKLNSIGTIPIIAQQQNNSSSGGPSIKFRKPFTTKTTSISTVASVSAAVPRNPITPSVVTENKSDRPVVSASVSASASSTTKNIRKPSTTKTTSPFTAASVSAAVSKNLITPSVVTEKKRDRPVVSASASASSTNKNIVTAATTTKKVVAHSNADLTTALFLTSLATKKQQSTKSKESDQTKSSITSNSKFGASIASEHTATISPSPSMAPPPAKSASSIGSSKSKTTVLSSSRKPTTTAVPPSSSYSIYKSSSGAVLSITKSSNSKTTGTIQQQQQPSREVILNEKIIEQYKQLRSFLQNITNRSMALIHSRNLRGPVPSALGNRSSGGSNSDDQNHLCAYSRLLTEHRAAHDYLQQRLLRSAETTLLLLLESSISVEEARTELKQTIKRFEEILYDILHRQEIERLGIVAQHHGTTTNLLNSDRSCGGKQRSSASPLSPGSVPKQTTTITYPCQAAFEKVEEICVVITRPVGRPKRGND